MLSPGKFSRLALAVASLFIGLLIVVVAAGVTPNGNSFSDLLQSAVVVWTGVCVLRMAVRSSGYLRRLWLLLTISVFLAAVAQVLKTYYKNVAHLPFASPWPSDILFILWVIPVLMMLSPRSETEHEGIDWQAILDFAQVAIVGLTAYLYFFYLTARWQAEGPRMVLTVLRVQMYRDLVLALAFFAQAIVRKARPIQRLFHRVALFFLVEVGWVLLYLVRWPAPLRGVYWSDVVWCAPYLFLTVFTATWEVEAAADTQEQSPTGRSALLGRVLPVCMPLAVLFMSQRIARDQVALAWAAITASFLVSTTRLILSSEKQRRITESLRQAETALQQSAEMFTTAFRSSPDAVSISLLPEGRFLVVNDSFLRMTGYTQEEVLGKSAADLKLWVDEEQRSRILTKVQTGMEIKEEEFLMRTKAGDLRMAQVSAARVQIGGRPGILGMVRDVTDRRRAEEALRISEERFRTLVQDLHVGIVLLGPKAETLFVNRTVLETFGMQHDEVLGKSTAQLEAMLLREDGTEMPFAERPGPRAIATKQAVEGQVVGWRREKHDEILWTLVDAVPHMTQGGEVTNVILSISDITEWKRAEAARRESEERFRTLVESLHVGVALMGAGAEILFANPAALEIFGLSMEEVLGKTSEQLGLIAFSENGTEMAFADRPVPKALATGQPVRNSVIGWQRPGSEKVFWILGEVVPLPSKDGRPNRLVAAFSDITKRKEAEEALRELSARLLRLQDEERRKLGRELHDSLAQRVMAVNLDLAVVRSAVSLDRKARHALSEARGVLREMSREIRTLSYLLHPPVLDELGLASAVREYARGFSERSGIALAMDIHTDFPRMPQETEIALFRIVQESLANIQRHSGSATGQIRLWNAEGRVQLEVSDQGHGITVEASADGRIGAKTSRLGVGILGMRERMVQLAGTLEVQSGTSGTTVRATIPFTFEGTHATSSHPRR